MCPDPSLLSAYYDDEIPDPWKKRLDGHLDGCPACQATLAAFADQTDRLVSDELRFPGDVDRKKKFWERLGYSRLVRIRGPRRLNVPWPALAAAAAVLASAITLNMVFLFRRSPVSMIVEAPPASPQTVVVAMPPDGLEALIHLLEGLDAEGLAPEAIRSLPQDLPLEWMGEPELVKPADLEREP